MAAGKGFIPNILPPVLLFDIFNILSLFGEGVHVYSWDINWLFIFFHQSAGLVDKLVFPYHCCSNDANLLLLLVQGVPLLIPMLKNWLFVFISRVFSNHLSAPIIAQNRTVLLLVFFMTIFDDHKDARIWRVAVQNIAFERYPECLGEVWKAVGEW